MLLVPSLRQLRLRRLTWLFALVPLLLLAACHQEFGTASHGGGRTGSPGTATLTNVRVGAHPAEGFDRVVFDFAGRTPAYNATYVPASELQAPSGRLVVPNGTYYLRVRLTDAVAPSAPARRTPDFAEVRDVRRVENFEGVVVYAVGVNQRNAFRFFALPDTHQLVLDVRR